MVPQLQLRAYDDNGYRKVLLLQWAGLKAKIVNFITRYIYQHFNGTETTIETTALARSHYSAVTTTNTAHQCTLY